MITVPFLATGTVPAVSARAAEVADPGLDSDPVPTHPEPRYHTLQHLLGGRSGEALEERYVSYFSDRQQSAPSG